MAKKLRPFSDSAHYQKFTADRDRALERILGVYLAAMDIVIDKLKAKTIALASAHPVMIDREFRLATIQCSVLVRRLRRESYLLAHAGEAQAMAAATGRPHAVKPRATDAEMPSGGAVEDRIGLILARLKRNVEDALQLSSVLGDTHEERIERLSRAFPAQRTSARKPQTLKRRRTEAPPSLPDTAVLKEAGGVFKAAPTYTDEDWEDILDDYTSDQLPDDLFARGPNDKQLFFDVDKDEFTERYSWELEQEVTEDFVQQVRSGENDAATENGVTDFLWNAVIDSKTDQCCVVRDGKTSAEIEKGMDDGSIDASDCDASVAPAHFNCRCKSVPMSQDLPTEEPPDFQGFDDWLDERANAA